MANPHADADALAFEMPFAKVVETASGESLLIAGRVYSVTGPDGNAADLFARAMRRSHNVDLTGSGQIVGMASANSTADA